MAKNNSRNIPDGTDRFSVYTDQESGERWRKYCLKHGVSFSQLATEFINYGIAHRPPARPKTHALPTGPRIKNIEKER